MSTSLKALLIMAATLVLLFVLGDRLGLRTGTRDPRTHVLLLDTAAVTSIHFEDRGDARHDLLLRRTPQGWDRIAAHERERSPDHQARELLGRFQELKVKRTMGMILLLGERYDLTDNTLCRITFTHADGREEALNIGSDTFAPGTARAWTYVNVPGEKEVYAVEGLLALGLRWPEQD